MGLQRLPKGGHGHVRAEPIIRWNREHLQVVPPYKHGVTPSRPLTNLVPRNARLMSSTTHQVHVDVRLLKEPTFKLSIPLGRINGVPQSTAVQQHQLTSNEWHVSKPRIEENINTPSAKHRQRSLSRSKCGITLKANLIVHSKIPTVNGHGVESFGDQPSCAITAIQV